MACVDALEVWENTKENTNMKVYEFLILNVEAEKKWVDQST